MIQHISVALHTQAAVALALRSWAAGAVAASVWAISREVTQAVEVDHRSGILYRTGNRYLERIREVPPEMDGLELANAFSELTDPVEQRARFIADMAEKKQIYGHDWPIDEDFLKAMEHGMPPCGGIALGVDRLVMLAAHTDDIQDVLWSGV